MVKKENRKAIREKKHARIRNRFSGTAQRPRLAVYRSNKHIYAQIIDDDAQKTLVSAGTVEKEIKDALENTDDIAAAEKVGEVIGKRAIDKGITEVVFDRGGYVYQGKIRESRKSSSTEAVMFIRARLQPLLRQLVRLALISKEGRLTHETCND